MSQFGTSGRLVGAMLVALFGRYAGENEGGTRAWAQSQGGLHARAVNVLQVSFEGCDPAKNASLLISRDGIDFEPVGAGLPRPWELLWSTMCEGSKTRLSILVVGRFAPGKEGFVFEEPGRYELRFRLSYEEEGKEPAESWQSVVVGNATGADVQFIERLDGDDFMQLLLERACTTDLSQASQAEVRETITGAPAGFRALVVVRELLEATRDHEPWVAARRQGPPDTGTVWPDTLWSLAQEFPDSSYASYGAYYAGCAYVSCVAQMTKQEHGRMIAPDARQNPYYEKAEAALSFCVERADVYLKPRALYMKAFLPLCAAQWEQVELALNEAKEQAPGEQTIREWVTQLRASVIRERERLDPTSSPDRE